MIVGVKNPAPDPEALRLMANGAKMASALPYVEHEIGKMKATVRTKAYQQLKDGLLSPETALALWQELYSYDRLLKRLQTHVKMGVSAADTVDIELD